MIQEAAVEWFKKNYDDELDILGPDPSPLALSGCAYCARGVAGLEGVWRVMFETHCVLLSDEVTNNPARRLEYFDPELFDKLREHLG